MFEQIMNEIESQNYAQEINQAREVSLELLVVSEGVQFNMIAFDQN